MKKINKKQKLIIFTAIIMVLVIIGIIIGANVIKTNIANGNYNSANSNSSSANLLPEYIKEGITLGGVTGSLVDLDTSDATATAMDIAYGETAYVNGEKITGLFVPRSSLKVGDYVDYIPDTASDYLLLSTVSGYASNQTISQDTNLTWRILSIDSDGTVELIGSIPSSKTITFQGALGYNNGVYILNDICAKLYSNKSLGTIARSINLDDVEKKMNATGINAKNSYNNGLLTYGSTTTCSSGFRYYPDIYRYENGSGINTTSTKKDGIGKSDSYYNEPTTNTYSNANILVGTQTYYYLNPLNNYLNDEIVYELLYGSSAYFLASRTVNCYSYDIYYNLMYIQGNAIAGNHMLRSNASTNGFDRCVRPIVQINTNIKIYGGDGSAEHPYQLSK